MEEIPILVNDLEVGKVVIQTIPTKAIKAARDAAFHISTTDDTQFCPFSDGSHKKDRGGVGLVYRRQWLPKAWAPEEPNSTAPSGDFVEQAWPYQRAVGNIAMEGVGVLEGLHAANEVITRDLHVLKAQNRTVMVRGTTDCVAILRHIAMTNPTKEKTTRTVPPQLIKKIKEKIQILQSHGIKVVVELHWCPRNKVPQLKLADELAGRAMSSGLGYCNVKQNVWAEATKSDMTLEIESMVEGVACTPLPKTTTGKSLKQRKQKKRRAQRATNVKTTSKGTPNSQPQLPLPALPPPSKPGLNTTVTVENTGSTTAPPKNPMVISTNDEQLSKEPRAVSNTESTQRPTTKAASEFPMDAQLSKEPTVVEGAKRKAVDEEKGMGEEKHTKKAKPTPANEDITKPVGVAHPPARPMEQPTNTMPAAWGLNLKTKIYINNPQTGEITEEPVERAPWIRTKTESTKNTGEKNIFISDGVSPFCLAKPKLVAGITLQV